MEIYQYITKIRRDYNELVANETMEDYALRYAPSRFRKWSEFEVANTAFGSTSFLVLEAIGGFLSINYGFTNAVWAIISVGLLIFITSFPISYYAARYHIDIDLLTRSAGFGYMGSTFTSLIYAATLWVLAAFHSAFAPGSLAVPAKASSTGCILSKLLCFRPTSSPWSRTPAKAVCNKVTSGS